MIDRVELQDPGQLQMAGLISSQFADQAKQLAAKSLLGEDLPPDFVNVDLESVSAGSSGKIFHRNQTEQDHYDRQMLDYTSAKKLLNFDGLKVIEKPRYLVKRWTVLDTAALPLVESEDNIHGWESVMLDPDEEGASKLVKRIEKYSMYYLNSADFTEDESFPGFYDAQQKIMMVHSQSQGLTLTAAKLNQDSLSKFGSRINVKNLANSNSVNNFTGWESHRESLELPSPLKFNLPNLCEGKSLTLLTAIYNGYGEMGPLRRNPQSIRAKEIKLDSKAISVKLMVSQDPDNLGQNLTGCKLDAEQMRYNPITMRFYHLDRQTSLRKLLWHEDDLDTNIEVRKCVVYNEDIGSFGAWDADKCTTVLSEQSSTVCECYTTGTFGNFSTQIFSVENQHFSTILFTFSVFS